MFPVIGAELEFYIINHIGDDNQWLKNSSRAQITTYLENYLKKNCDDIVISYLDSITQERPEMQYEMKFIATDDIRGLTTAIIKIRKQLMSFTEKDLSISFAAKPFVNLPGSALHIHISVHQQDSNDKIINLFTRKINSRGSEDYSDYLRWAIGGLCDKMQDDISVFAPNPESHLRFVAGFEAPINISWGGNNRTVALRIPTSDPANLRIEHRVAGADVDILKAFSAVMEAVFYGINNKITPPPKIFGNANLSHYNLKKLYFTNS